MRASVRELVDQRFLTRDDALLARLRTKNDTELAKFDEQQKKAEEEEGETEINAILKAPVDLLWFGGIGTYIKAATQSHVDVGDPAVQRRSLDGGAGTLDLRQLGHGEKSARAGKVGPLARVVAWPPRDRSW